MTRQLLEIENLSVEFLTSEGWGRVTHDVSFSLERGRTLALVGESGSGKSVTAMSILNLLPPNSRREGSVFFGGIELTALDENELRKYRGGSIATIFQEPMTALNPVYTIGAQLSAALRSHSVLSQQEARERCVTLLDEVHMPEPENMLRRYPHQLSGGQRQRAMIAMAISSDPVLLVADEPTTALDVTVQAEILDLIAEHQQRLNMALLLITHDMGVVAEVADEVAVLKDGRIVESAPAVPLFRDPQDPYTKALLAAVPRLGEAENFFAEARQADGGSAAASTGSTDERNGAPVLKLDETQIRYPGKWRQPGFQAVNGVSVEVASGEIVGLVGESGSGKTTIGKAVVGLVKVAGGAMEVLGHQLVGIGKRERAELRRDVAMVFQDPASSLNPRRTIGQTVTDPLRWQRLELNVRARRSRAQTLLEQVQIDPDWVDRFPHELSGGQRQRVGIARAIATSPKLLVADEPTSALDVSVQAQVLDLFLGLQRAMGFSCLFISHDLSVVEALSNRVVVLRDGAVVEQGPTPVILRTPKHDYTKRLIAAAPVPDPEVQRRRSEARRGRKEQVVSLHGQATARSVHPDRRHGKFSQRSD